MVGASTLWGQGWGGWEETREKLTKTILSSTWTDVACSRPLKRVGVLQSGVGGRTRGRWPIHAGVWNPHFSTAENSVLPAPQVRTRSVAIQVERKPLPSFFRKGDSGHFLGVCLHDSLPFRVFYRGSEGWQDGTPPPMCAQPYCPAKLQPPRIEATVARRHHSAIFTCLEHAWLSGSWVFPRAWGYGKITCSLQVVQNCCSIKSQIKREIMRDFHFPL